MEVEVFDHFQFALIQGPSIPSSYAVLLFTALDFTSISSHIHNRVLFLLRLHLFILSGVISSLISSSILGTYHLGSPSFSVLSFCLFILFMGLSRQEYWSGLPFLSPLDHILSEITRWSILTSDWLYSLQPKMEKLYTVRKNKTRSWLSLRSWTPYCQIQT